MRIILKRADAIRAFCVARQAERSIDFALASQKQWNLLREYYDESRLNRIHEVRDFLQNRINPDTRKIPREELPWINMRWVITYPLRLLINRHRRQWRFRPVEIRFIAATLAEVVAVLRHGDKPDAKELVELRMDLSACQRIIELHLTGVVELERAQYIEHFCQAFHIHPVKMEELCGSPAMASAA